MKKDYSGILICTDYDGTMAYDGVPQENIDAIENFKKHGGLFTLATGRANYEVTPDILPVKPNAPLVCMIGSRLYDLDRGESLMDAVMDGSCAEIVKRAAMAIPCLESASIYKSSRRVHFTNHTEEEIDRGLAEFGDDTFKIVFWLTGPYTQELFDKIEAICGDRCNLCSNREDILEITAPGVHKGTAVRKLKELLGAKILITAGDTNGDIPMLLAADIGYAVENASDEVKAAADRITVHAKDAALARIIEDIDQMLTEKTTESES